MTIKQQGGIFGRNPTFNDVTVDGTLTASGSQAITDDLTVGNNVLYVDAGSGNVGINTDSPNIHGWTKALTVNTTTNTAIELSRDGTKKAAFALQGDDRIQITSFEADPVQLRTANADRLVVSGTGDGDVTISTGNLVIGTSGKGIDFSATSDAAGSSSELFDDYEEGTWTPAYSTDGTDFTSVTHTSQNGYYVKIGRQVFCNMFIRTSSVTVGSASGNLIVTGLPYTSNISSQGIGGTVVSTFGWGGDAPNTVQVASNNTFFYMSYYAVANRTYNNNYADLSTSSNNDMYATFMYWV